MDYKIVEKEEFTVIGKSAEFTTKDGENLRGIPLFWQEVNEDGTSDKLIEIGVDKDLLGICTDMNHAQETFSYRIAVEGGPETDPQGYATTVIPAATWAVFTSVGPMPHAIQKVWGAVFQEWFPSSGVPTYGRIGILAIPARKSEC